MSDAESDPPAIRAGLDAKLVLVGNSGAGKTCIMIRYVEGTFQETRSTIGASFLTKNVVIDDIKVRLQVWDTAGQERFRSMAPMYYRGAHGAVVAFEVTSRASFDALKEWIVEIRSNVKANIVIAIVGNKIDMKAHREGIDKVFVGMARQITAQFIRENEESSRAKQDARTTTVTIEVRLYND